MPSCLAYGCSNTSGKTKETKSFFKIPHPKRDRSLCKRWLHNMGNSKYSIDNFEASANRVLCSDHFHPDCLKRDLMFELLGGERMNKKRLVVGAIPTIFSYKIFEEINIDGTTVSVIPSGSQKQKETLEQSKLTVAQNSIIKQSQLYGDKQSYKCTVCDTTFKYHSKLKTHMRKNLCVRSIKCSICDVSFTYNYLLKQHMRKHTDEKLYECSVCGKTFKYKIALMRHKRLHTGERPYKSDICGDGFITSSNMKYHLKKHTTEKIIDNNNDVHAGEKTFKCLKGDRSFSNSAKLEIHIRKHTYERPYECSFCKKTFRQNIVLKQHERLHTGEKPYKCSICDDAFIQSSGLKYHLKKHTNEKMTGNDDEIKVIQKSKKSTTHSDKKLYKCSICDRSFTYNSIFQQHMRKHTGEKPFECSFCKKSFKQKSGLTYHERLHTGEKPYQCSICNDSFIMRTGLKYHMKEHSISAEMIGKVHDEIDINIFEDCDMFI